MALKISASPCSRNARHVHAVALLSGAIGIFILYATRDLGTQAFGILACCVALVTGVWSAALSLRALRNGERKRWPLAVLLLCVLETLAPYAVFGMNLAPVFRPVVPSKLMDPLSYALALLPIFLVAWLVTIPLARMIARGRTKDSLSPQQRFDCSLRWAMGFLSLLAIVLPWPLFVLGAYHGVNAWPYDVQADHDWYDVVAQQTPDIVRDSIEWITRDTFFGSNLHERILEGAFMSRRRQIEDLDAHVSRFKAAPNQDEADEIAERLDRYDIPFEHGSSILQLILKPDVFARKSYRIGPGPNINLYSKYHLNISNVKWISTHSFTDEIDNNDGTGRRYDWNTTNALFAWCYPNLAALQATGKHRVKMVVECGVANRVSLEDRYRCAFKYTVEFEVVPAEKTEHPEVRNNLQLDAEMRAAFAVAYSDRGLREGLAYDTPSGKRTAMGDDLHFSHLAENMMCDVSFMEASGIERKFKRPLIVERSSWGYGRYWPSWKPPLAFDDLRIEEIGIHRGKLILKSNPDLADNYPEFKTMWGGTIEIPFSITVEKAPP